MIISIVRQSFGAFLGVGALLLGATASAATCSVGSCTVTDGELSHTTAIGIGGSDVALGAVDHQGSFSISPAITHADAFVDIAFDEILPGESQVRAGFSNLTIEFFQDMTSLGSFVLTNADGTKALQTFVIAFISASDVFFEISGESFRNAGASLPDYNIDMIGTPVPGAFILLLSGVAGLGFSMRRGRAKA